MQIKIEEKQGVEEWRIVIKERFGFDTARACVAAVRARPWNRQARLVFDLTDAEHLESSGLGAMLLLVERMPSAVRPEIRFRGAGILAVLQVAHMERHFDLVPVGGLAALGGLPQKSRASVPKSKA
jgi:anti-anti-sigma regulatory factor